MEPCPACGSNVLEAKHLLSSIALNVCAQCGLLISQIKRPDTVEPEFSRIDESAYHQAVGGLRQHQAAEILNFVKAHASGLKDWLDIGCSFGYLLIEARTAGYHVSGVEPDQRAFTHACAMLGENVVQHGSMKDDTVTDSSLDIISRLDVLEHVPSKELTDFARIIYRKLRPDGLWVIKVPSTDGLYFKLAHGLLAVSS